MLGKTLNKLTLKYLSILIFICICVVVKAQNTSSSEDNYKLQESSLNIHNPHKATIYSALVPGLGQVYNKKYWKLPVIYGATGVLIYAFNFNNELYNKYKIAYADMDAGRITSFENISNKETLLRAKDKYRRDRDLNVILLAAIYLLNIIDATVDAHLFDYKITEDLSFNINPSVKNINGQQNACGISLQFNF